MRYTSIGFKSHSALYLKYGSSVYTGSILRRQIEAHGYNTRDLAMLIGSTKELLDGIVAEQEALTMDIAQGLEMLTNSPIILAPEFHLGPT